MDDIIMTIDTKSLYMNIKNDNSSGHTATVATPIRQGNSYREDLGQIFSIKKFSIDFENMIDFIHELTKNSKSKIKIKEVFVFDKLSVNGINIESDKSFCMYVKEEIDPAKAQFGRLKLHYPMSLRYSDINYDIDNKEVLKKISSILYGYAFIIKSFNYNKKTSILNFNAIIVGEHDVPYSKVFINEKGSGNKFNPIFNDYADNYDMEIIALRSKYGDDVNTETYLGYVDEINKKASNMIIDIIKKKGGKNIVNMSQEYPYSLYNLRYELKNKVRYAIINWTATKINYFNLSMSRNLFFRRFSDSCDLFLITNILDKKASIKKFLENDLDSMTKRIHSIVYTKEN